jgi:RNA polymerase-binding transcription factor DksA
MGDAAMSDEVDLTNERLQADLDRKIAAARNNVPHQIGPEVCENCDEQIPHVRRQLGYALCVPCAAEVGRERQLHGGRYA